MIFFYICIISDQQPTQPRIAPWDKCAQAIHAGDYFGDSGESSFLPCAAGCFAYAAEILRGKRSPRGDGGGSSTPSTFWCCMMLFFLAVFTWSCLYVILLPLAHLYVIQYFAHFYCSCLFDSLKAWLVGIEWWFPNHRIGINKKLYALVWR